MKMNKSQRQLNRDIIVFLLNKGADCTQLTLKDKSCEDLLQNHCNKEDLLDLLQVHREKNQQKKEESKPIKRIAPDFFKIAPK